MPTPQRLTTSGLDPTDARPDLPTGAICTERIIIPTFNAEFVPESDGGPCVKAPVLRLTIRHDGTSCGCDGTCQIPDPAQPGSDPPGRWTEVRLLCADHVYEYRADGALDVRPPAVTIEDLT